MDPAAVLWMAAPLCTMAAAAAYDVRSRRVPDACWAVMCAFGIASALLHDGTPSGVLAAASAASVAAWMLCDRFSGIRTLEAVVPAVAAAYASYLLDPGIGASPFVPIVMAALFYAMYLSGAIRGGADAKCLMSVAVAYPVYPSSGSVPILWDPPEGMDAILNPSVSVLCLALAISMLWGLSAAVRNIRAGRIGPGMFRSFRMPAEKVPGAFVWPVDGGRTLFDDRDAEELLRRAASEGATEIEVTPMIPFVLPLFAACTVTVLLGSPLFALI